MNIIYVWCSNMASRLQQERKKLKLLADVVIKKINCGKSTYTRWEAGSPIPSDKLLLLSELGFDVNYIVTGKKTGQSIDASALEQCIKGLEETIEKNDGVLDPSSKAKLIVFLYETLVAGEEVDNEKIARHIRLVS